MRPLFLFCHLLLIGAAFAGETWEARCIGVSGGDAITVERQGEKTEIRIYGVDCPARGQDYYLEATKYTHALVHEKNVLVEPVTTDADGRMVALVFVDGAPLTNRIIGAGFGTVSLEYCRDSRLCLDWRSLEAEAIRDGLGMWSGGSGMADKNAQRIKRIETKAGKIYDEVQKARDGVAGKRRTAPPPPPQPTSGFVGTPRTKRLHRITCRNAKVPEKEFFPTVNAGLDAGYSLCKLCKPVP